MFFKQLVDPASSTLSDLITDDTGLPLKRGRPVRA